jgi:hypothetical protein
MARTHGIARLLACGGLSNACRRPSHLSLLAHATAWSGSEQRSWPEGRRAEPVPDLIRECPESRKVTQRNGLSSPPTLQALTVEVSWNLRSSSCYTNGHTAPSPIIEAREWISLSAIPRFPQRRRKASFPPLSLRPLTVIPAALNGRRAGQAGIQWSTRAQHTHSMGAHA